MSYQSVMPSSNRPGGGFFWRPSISYNAFSKDGIWHHRFFCQLSQRAAITINGYEHIGARISALNFTGCPSTIFRRIGTIIINAINGVTCRTFAHVIKEVSKRIPSLTNSYTSPSIVLKSRVSWIITTPSHAFPHDMRRGSGHPMLEQVRSAWHINTVNLFGANVNVRGRP